MAQAVYHSEGCTLDYTPVAAASAGDVVSIAGMCGVVVTDLEADQLGAVQIEGIVKVTNTATVFAAGDSVEYDNETATAVATTLGDVVVGTCVYAAAAGEDVAVLLNR